jgi:hypothetical protein
MTSTLENLLTIPNLLGVATSLLLLTVLKQQTPTPTCRPKLQSSLHHANTTTKITALLVVGWSLLLAFEIVQWQTPSHIAAICLLGCLISLGLQIHSIRGLTHKLSEVLMEETVAIISLFKDKSQEMHLWFKKTGQEWPPLEIQVGENHLTQPLQNCTPETKEKVRELMRKTKAFENKEFQKDFRETLQKAGVSHPVDVQGNDHIREIQTFLEETLLNQTPENA